MKYQDCVSGRVADSEFRRATTSHDRDQNRSPGLDMTLQTHLGRTLRRVYEPHVGSDLPREISDLLQQLDSIRSRAPRKYASQTDGLAR